MIFASSNAYQLRCLFYVPYFFVCIFLHECGSTKLKGEVRRTKSEESTIPEFNNYSFLKIFSSENTNEELITDSNYYNSISDTFNLRNEISDIPFPSEIPVIRHESTEVTHRDETTSFQSDSYRDGQFSMNMTPPFPYSLGFTNAKAIDRKPSSSNVYFSFSPPVDTSNQIASAKQHFLRTGINNKEKLFSGLDEKRDQLIFMRDGTQESYTDKRSNQSIYEKFNHKEKTFTIGYLTGSHRHENDKQYMRPGLQISGAITLAVNEVNKHQPLAFGYKLDFTVAETFGQELESILQTAKLRNLNVSAYIGPQETCIHEAKVAAAFNLPMISYFCTHPETSNKEDFPTFARTRPPDSQISKSVAAVLTRFNWRKVIFLHNDSPDENFSPVAKTIESTFLHHNITLLATKVWNSTYFHAFMDNIFEAMLQDTYNECRIFVVLGFYYEFLGIMSTMEERGLFKLGEYFVVGVMLQEYNRLKPEQYLQDFLSEESNSTLQRAYQNFIGVIPTAPVGSEEFNAKVDTYLGQEPFNYPNAIESLGGIKTIRPEAAYLYDAVILYARALNATLLEGGNPLNGTEIIQWMLRTFYRSARGYIVHMDRHGDAEGNYTLLARRPLPSRPSEFGLFPVGDFRYSGDNSGLPELHLTKEIEFKGGKVPIDEPPCGFSGEKCLYQTTEIIAGIAGSLALLFVIFLLLAYRNWKYEQELDSLLWKIDYKDVKINEFPSPNNNLQVQSRDKLSRNLCSTFRSSQVSLNSNIGIDSRLASIYTQLGVYRGRIVAVKHISCKTIDITRKVKKELKTMRDLRHDHLLGFIGACVDPPNTCFLTEYCTRGSLKDILENDDVKLDKMFIASLTGDIVQGMIFLHDSPLKFHGNLKTSNCLVDSRWVVKISDYGLNSLKASFQGMSSEDIDEAKITYDLLYRAPELLRDPIVVGTQKGDVYSFAIILYELHGRNGPYGLSELSPLTIVNHVKSGARAGKDIYRPPLHSLENCMDCVRLCLTECWAENPEDRPDFRAVRQKLRPIRKGMKPNIFDNMLEMMEKYANNLEALVDERTDLLIEEKKKTDALLYEMLPRVVAEQLKMGLGVEAESFDCVTIFFSDIVGFTEMSAESTALQIVDFLNNLYTCFDSIIENYDVYKVETIGDAYMVVSGLPIRNGNDHTREIASMSFHLLESIKKFKIRHRPHDTLKLRIGVHSGPVCAGVVGVKMPRYCLFGDTVNTASRMESQGAPLKIHCSSTFRGILTSLGGYQFEERGKIKVKGKGEMTTYWLIGEEKKMRLLRELRKAQKTSEEATAPAQNVSVGGFKGSKRSFRGRPKVIQNLPNDNAGVGQQRLRFVQSDDQLPLTSKNECSKEDKQSPSTPTSLISITLPQVSHEKRNSLPFMKVDLPLSQSKLDGCKTSGEDSHGLGSVLTHSSSELSSILLHLPIAVNSPLNVPEVTLPSNATATIKSTLTPTTSTLPTILSTKSLAALPTLQNASSSTTAVHYTPQRTITENSKWWPQNLNSRNIKGCKGSKSEDLCHSKQNETTVPLPDEDCSTAQSFYEESSPLLTQVVNYNVIKDNTTDKETPL